MCHIRVCGSATTDDNDDVDINDGQCHSDGEDRVDVRRMTRLDINDIPSEHPGTEIFELPRVSGLFHMVAEPRRSQGPACHQ